MTDDEVYHVLTKLHQWNHVSQRWTIKGYKCPYCGHHYHSLRKEIYNHVRDCDGPKHKPVRNFED